MPNNFPASNQDVFNALLNNIFIYFSKNVHIDIYLKKHTQFQSPPKKKHTHNYNEFVHVILKFF